VNYIDFIQSVDPLFVGQIMEGDKVPVKTWVFQPETCYRTNGWNSCRNFQFL